MPDLSQDMVQALVPQQPLFSKDISQSFLSGASNMLGIDDATRALRGEMTPEEQQNFFFSQVPNLMPEFKGAGAASLAALHLMPRALLPKPKDFSLIEPVTLRTQAVTDALFGHGEPGAKSFDITNDTGQNVARMWTSQTNPKQLYVNYIGGINPLTGDVVDATSASKGALGTKEMMSLIPELKKHFPDVEEIGGYRVSGARPVPGSAVMKLKK